jgi:hypothetical protein
MSYQYTAVCHMWSKIRRNIKNCIWLTRTHQMLYLVLEEWNSAVHLLRCTAPCILQKKNSDGWKRWLCISYCFYIVTKTFIIDYLQKNPHCYQLMHSECLAWCFSYITAMESKMQMKNYFGLQVKRPSWLADFNKTCTVCNAFAMRDRCDVSLTSLQWKARYRWKTTSASKKSALHYWPISNKITLLVAHAYWYLGAMFRLHHCSGGWDTEKKLHWNLSLLTIDHAVFPPRHYHYTAVYPCSLCTVAFVIPARHNHYTGVYFLSLITLPCVLPHRYYRAYKILNSVQIFLLPLICAMCNTFLTKKNL